MAIVTATLLVSKCQGKPLPSSATFTITSASGSAYRYFFQAVLNEGIKAVAVMDGAQRAVFREIIGGHERVGSVEGVPRGPKR
ncbi:hypothetical protein KUL25_11235 [Rhodobacteraceae bacterium N5(2021)]|uniref:Uncharacterized protein n=1 Tax=Gymnodinialimonas phycosphaerae TaxID=2841589 RepID=A0A975TR59_9RHOB|nr:hypothetical protein [Gymnodinialimonas phycosphaerae]MBY4893337.1 hypothetical protein [Gymnodinialimonas phycosphaerae]